MPSIATRSPRQLVYEIGDPAHYLTPDVDVDFTTVEIYADAGPDRVAVRGNRRPAPEYAQALARLPRRLHGQRAIARLRRL